MISTGQNDNVPLVELVDEAVLIVNSSRPTTCEVRFKSLGLPNAVIGRPKNIPNQSVNALQKLAVPLLEP
jgi:hypothetical protein